MPWKPCPDRFRRSLEGMRLKLADVHTVPQLAVLGLLSGLLAGGVIVLFRLVIETSQAGFLPEGQTENYEALSTTYRLALPTLGGLLIGLLLRLAAKSREVGVVHVMERLAYYRGYLPLRNGLVQFAGAAVSIISGHSVGREGPTIHLGATSGSLLGQWLGLSNTSIRTLVACGVAAAIAAGFNTPLAGVVFAMEVVMMEYSITGFVPVILAAVSGTTVTRLVYGADTAFFVPTMQMGSLLELPVVLVMGVAIGGLAALFIHLLQIVTVHSARVPLVPRTTLAGLIVGLCALGAPEVMGIGYDTVNSAMLGELGLWLMVIVALSKLLATAAGLGLGLPGGLIGPTLVIGASAGGAIGLVALQLIGTQDITSPGFYAMVGMGAMMAATLQAPLAALMALLELTANPNIILPGMLAVISAGLISSEVFGKPSVYIMLMRARGLDYRNDPVSQSLRRIGVGRVMNRNFIVQTRQLERKAAERLLKKNPLWILVEEEGLPREMLPAADLAHFLEAGDDTEIDLLDFPAMRKELAPIHLRSTLQEALDQLLDSEAEALYITRGGGPEASRILGVITQEDIEQSYRYR